MKKRMRIGWVPELSNQYSPPGRRMPCAGGMTETDGGAGRVQPAVRPGHDGTDGIFTKLTGHGINPGPFARA